MIKEISIQNLGPIAKLEVKGLSNINLIIGPNQSGKTFLMKSLYTALRTVELCKRGKVMRSDSEILSDRLYWNFQVESLGNIVRKNESKYSFAMKSAGKELFKYSFGTATTKSVSIESNTFHRRDSNTVFIPAKEVISIKDIIFDSHEDQQFGFEEPYYDLVKLLGKTKKGRNKKEFSDARQNVTDMIGGRLEFNEEQQAWFFKDKNRKVYEINSTSEGVKKVSILDILLGNHYLDEQSIVIIDELEANLHPSLIKKLLNTILLLSQAGLQFFISSHSYFVIKYLYILAHQQNVSVPVISFSDHDYMVADLKEEMPKNPIIDESINLYKEEISL